MPTAILSTALLTDVGRLRKQNEDTVGEDTDLGLVVLADGMGGHNAGEVASGIAVASIVGHVRAGWPERSALHDPDGVHTPESLLLREAMETANRTIHRAAEAQPQYAGMGTTAIACLLHEGRAHIAHVGDSRLYRLRDGGIEQITRDHSIVEELVTRAGYPREVAQEMVSRNHITRALGAQPSVEVDLIEEPTEPGDLLLICSDGLHDMISDEVIAGHLAQHSGPLARAAEELVAAANGAGGRDNISVVLIRVERGFQPADKWYKRLLEWF